MVSKIGLTEERVGVLVWNMEPNDKDTKKNFECLIDILKGIKNTPIDVIDISNLMDKEGFLFIEEKFNVNTKYLLVVVTHWSNCQEFKEKDLNVIICLKKRLKIILFLGCQGGITAQYDKIINYASNNLYRKEIEKKNIYYEYHKREDIQEMLDDGDTRKELMKNHEDLKKKGLKNISFMTEVPIVSSNGYVRYKGLFSWKFVAEEDRGRSSLMPWDIIHTQAIMPVNSTIIKKYVGERIRGVINKIVDLDSFSK